MLQTMWSECVSTMLKAKVKRGTNSHRGFSPGKLNVCVDALSSWRQKCPRQRDGARGREVGPWRA